ncbi:MAG TPA: lytic transglycosylase domain-containing protein [Opitutaceae bacterium]
MLLSAAITGAGSDANAGDQPATSPSLLEDLLDAGRDWYDENVPADVREQYTLPNAAAVESFLADIESAFADGSFEQLAAYAPGARQALTFLRAFEGGEELADWLEPRLDFLVASEEELAQSPQEEAGKVPPPVARARPTRPGETSAVAQPKALPAPALAPAPVEQRKVAERATGTRSRDHWQRVIARRPVPPRARSLVPALKRVFRDSGVPPEWVWIAEVESSMNPQARSPAGARGLFQFMPATAERFGLRTSWPDERLDPEKSARAAAQYLRFLHGKFQSWPLAVAAYNSGEGRVGRLLKSTGKDSFEAIHRSLPAETQLYVPKVIATVAVREGIDPERLPAPSTVFNEPESPPGNRRSWVVAHR